MKHLFYIVMLAGLMFTAGCSEEFVDSSAMEQTNHAGKVVLTIGMPNSEGGSRIAYNDDQLNLSWDEGDQIIVVGYDSDDAYVGDNLFLLQEGAGSSTAKFSGELPEASSYKVFYNAGNLKINKGMATLNYTGQIQASDNSTAHLKDYLYLSTGENKLTREELMDNKFVLQLHNSVFRFDIASFREEVGKVQSLLWTTNAGGENSASSFLQLQGDFTAAKGLTAYIVFDPAVMALKPGQEISLTFFGDKASYIAKARSVNGKTYQPGYRYHARVSASKDDKALSTWTAIAEPKDNEIVITTTDGKPVKCSFANQTLVPGTNVYILSNDENPIKSLNTDEFQYEENLYSVHLPSQLTELAGSAFYGCDHLVSVKFPAGLLSIGNYCFSDCSSLGSIDLPEGLISIGQSAFESTGLTSLTLPSTVQSIGTYVCRYCNRLVSAYIPDKITSLPKFAFDQCPKLTTVTGCVNVETLGKNAFTSCESLVSYPFTEKLTTIESSAFEECYSFSTPLPLSIKMMGDGVITDSQITEFTVYDGLQAINSWDYPIRGAAQLKKISVTTADPGATEFLINEAEYNPHYSEIDLYLLNSWRDQTDDNKPDFVALTWAGYKWKSITLIDSDGNAIKKEEAGHGLPEVGEGGSAL